MADLICRKTMMRCQTQGMCSPFGGCQPSVLADCKTTQSNSSTAPSPAGVDGCKCSMSISMLGDGCRHCQPQEYIDRLGEMLDEERSELSDAQAIIDGLRAEVGAQRVKTCATLKARNDAHEERDQQAQRTGELEGLLRDFAYHTQRREMPTESSLAEWADRIDSTLSSGKEGE